MRERSGSERGAGQAGRGGCSGAVRKIALLCGPALVVQAAAERTGARENVRTGGNDMKALKWVGIGVGALAALVVVVVLGAQVAASMKLGERYPVRELPVPAVPTDAAALAEGERLWSARGCAECHAADGGGKAAIDDPGIGRVSGTNLTRGKGGIGAELTGQRFVRAMHHCVKPDGRSLILMPCVETRLVPEHEVGMLLAHVRAMKPVDREFEVEELSVLGRTLLGLGLLPLVSAEAIDFDFVPPPAPQPGPTAAYGERLAQIQCTGCHGEGLSGGAMPGAPPTLPVPTNITRHETGIAKWGKGDFVTLLKTGKRPDGTDVNPFMPWSTYKHLNDQELDALWAYLQTKPAQPFGNR